MPDSWECLAWKARGGYGSQSDGRGRENAGRERIWFSPNCLQPQSSLFASLNTDSERCDREINEIKSRSDVRSGEAPAWLVTMGVSDWEAEKRLIEAEDGEASA
jgi:hypothetical protein